MERAMETSVTRSIYAADSEARYDALCKRLLSEKWILGWIMKSCLEEYRDCTPREIVERYIEGTPQVGEEPVFADDAPRIHGMGNEDASPREGTVVYDIRFTALAPATGEPIRLIINLEAQNKFHPGYPLIKRALYYVSRLISAQHGTEFTHGHYEKIRKVYSIWICFQPPENRQNTVYRYQVTEDVLAGNPRIREKRENYDLMTVLLLCLGSAKDETENRALELLNVLLSVEERPEQKLQVLENDFQIPISQQFDKEVSQMCNLSQGVLELGLKEGLEQGLERGRKEGREEGRAEGRAEERKENILKTVRISRKFHASEEEILQQLMEEFSLTEKEARTYMAAVQKTI